MSARDRPVARAEPRPLALGSPVPVPVPPPPVPTAMPTALVTERRPRATAPRVLGSPTTTDTLRALVPVGRYSGSPLAVNGAFAGGVELDAVHNKRGTKRKAQGVVGSSNVSGAEGAAGVAVLHMDVPRHLNSHGSRSEGSRSDLKASVKQKFVRLVMDRWGEARKCGGGGMQPSDFVEAVVPPNLPASKVAQLKRTVDSASARANVLRDASAEYRHRLAEYGRRNRGSGEFPEMERALMQKFKARRKRGKKIGGFWLRMNARRICKRLYVGRTPPHPKAARAASFCASNGWATRVVKRHDIVPRRRTNFKKLSLRFMLPKYHRYFRWMKRDVLPVRDAAGQPIIPGHPEWDALPAEKKKWGRLPPWRRFNVDQVKCVVPSSCIPTITGNSPEGSAYWTLMD